MMAAVADHGDRIPASFLFDLKFTRTPISTDQNWRKSRGGKPDFLIKKGKT